MSETKTDSLSAALGKGKQLIWQGKPVEVLPFDMNDVADLEDALGGDVTTLDVRKVRHQQIVLWIVVRRLDPTLTPEQRRACQYNMTLQDFGRSVKASQINRVENFIFLTECVRISGLYGDASDDAETGAASKNEEAASD